VLLVLVKLRDRLSRRVCGDVYSIYLLKRTTTQGVDMRTSSNVLSKLEGKVTVKPKAK